MKIKKVILTAGVFSLLISGLIAVLIINSKASRSNNDILVLDELPFEIEPFNPVPAARHWNEAGRTFYYFNWGIKNSGGYSLQFEGLKGNTLRIKALRPHSNDLTIQVITFPKLFLSLPKGNYQFEVVDEENRPVKNLFKPKNPPLRFAIFLPDGEQIRQRIIFRDPYQNTEGKTTALIALEGLFSQIEMLDFLEHEVTIDGVSFSRQQKSWYLLMSPSYQSLDPDHRDLLAKIMTQTVLSIKAEGLENVVITSDPAKILSD